MSTMLWVLFGGHLLGVVAAGLAGRSGMRPGLSVAAIAPAATAGWAAARLVADPEPVTSELVWVQGLDLTIRFRIDDVALLMTLLVSGIGALVFVYGVGYFADDAPAGSKFPATLLGFSAAMLGLVWADSIWTLFIFWELTSITSFLLVGHKDLDADVRQAARRALLITGVGGLVLLAGLLLLAAGAGSTDLTVLADTGAV
ncbi:MAG: proton-conducting transporter membrane subunit, partial [Actinomycetota bacterium]